jgi:hypothetical protein
MVSTGNRGRSEMRKKPRRPLHYSAKIVTDGKDRARACTISDISEIGARLVLDSDDELPERFFLLLTTSGRARRRCRVVWRTGTTVGVAFMTGP